MKKKVFWIAGEKSGDLHASFVLKELAEILPELSHYGIGGSRMEQYGFKSIYPFERFSVMGFVEVIKHILFFLKVEKQIRKIFRKDPPDLIVLVDYPGLNMRIARMAKKYQIPVLYYICPQFWAWKKKRLDDLAAFTDHVAYILPFEGKFLDENDIDSTYVGHPIAEEIIVSTTKKDFAAEHDLDLKKQWLGFLPGSRDNEIKKMLPVYLDAISQFQNKDFQFLISRSDSVSEGIFTQFLKKFPEKNIRIIEHDNYSLMKHCDLIISTSGTATLETAYIGTPFLIAYKASKLTYELGKRFIKIKRIGLPNIILDKDLAPELIQKDANGDKIKSTIENILNDKKSYNSFKQDLKQLHELLGKRSASQQTSSIIVDLLSKEKEGRKKKKNPQKTARKFFDPLIFFLEKYLAAFVILLLGITYRFNVKTLKPKGNVIYAFWHRNLLPLAYLRKYENVVVLISRSRDGQFIAGPIEALGFKTARGSSSKGGSKALRELIKISKKHSLAITPDGPKGPKEKIKEGLIRTAYLTKLPIVLVVVDVDKEKVFNSWDRFRFPYPFARINVTYGDQIFVEEKDNIDGIIEDLEREFKLLEYKNKILRG